MLKSQNKIGKFQYWYVIIFVIAIHFVLVYRFFELQVLDHEMYTKQAENNRVRAISLPAPRGLILDRNNEIIVDNYPTYILYGIKSEIQNEDKNYIIINKTTGIPIQILKKNYKNNFRNRFLPARLAKDLTIVQLSRLEEEKNDLSGIIYKQFPERIFNSKIRASHILGYLKEIDTESLSNHGKKDSYQLGDLIGWSGIEKKYESILRGKKGVSYYQVDAFGREAGKINNEDNILTIPGNNIKTTIDIPLQSLVESQLKNKKGVIIVSKPKTGEILSYASAPDYEPDLFTGLVSNQDWRTVTSDSSRPLLNRATNGIYPPGSIFKMVVGFEILEKQLVSPEWSVICTGEYEYFDRVHRCWAEDGHGKINLEQAIVQSCDIYFYEVIQKIKLNDIAKRAKEFGYGLESKIDLPTEMPGRMPDRNFMNELYGKWGWSKGALLNISIGQGEILVTPIQMANYTNLLATKGDAYPAYLVESLPSKISFPKYKINNWKLIQDAMRKVISGSMGTGKKADPKIPGLIISGKTGTAENPHGEAHAWFIAYGEKNNEMISIVVLIENGGSGGTFATPIAREIFKYYFTERYTDLAEK